MLTSPVRINSLGVSHFLLVAAFFRIQCNADTHIHEHSYERTHVHPTQ